MPAIQFGIYLPNVAWDSLPGPSELVAYAVAAEQLGLDSVWVEDRLLHARLGILEPLTTLTFVASRTQRLLLGTSILLVNLRNPLVLAKTLSTLDYLCGGRVVLGASLGGRPEEYRAAGVPMRTRVTRFVETVKAMRAFWGEGSSDGVSRFFEVPEQPIQPSGMQRSIPIWIGGRAEPVLRRAATLGDGWLASSTSDAAEFAQGWARVQEYAIAVGRNPATLMPAKFVYFHIEESAARALAVLEERLPRYYTSAYDAASLAIYGPPDRCVEQAQALLAVGVRTLIFSPVTRERIQLERLALRVLPELRPRSRQ